jgi:uncharacterized protein with NRDE domain
MNEKKGEFQAQGTRYLCDILDDMRKAYETRNFSYLLGMIEELQYRANRMESRINDISSVEGLENKRIALTAEIKKLKKERKRLEAEKGDDPGWME